eukprot:scaffold583_cov176-Amphora_coffeaeformis.AAC.8
MSCLRRACYYGSLRRLHLSFLTNKGSSHYSLLQQESRQREERPRHGINSASRTMGGDSASYTVLTVRIPRHFSDTLEKEKKAFGRR